MLPFLFLLVGIVFLQLIIDWSAFTRSLEILFIVLDHLIVALFIILLLYSFSKTCVLLLQICDYLIILAESNRTSFQ